MNRLWWLPAPLLLWLGNSGTPSGFTTSTRLQGPDVFRAQAQDRLARTVRGEFLPFATGGPSTQLLAEQAIQPVLSQFTAAGRGPGRSGLVEAEIARAAAEPFARRFGEERQLQQNAAQSGETLQTSFQEPFFTNQLAEALGLGAGALGLLGGLGGLGGQGGGLLGGLSSLGGLVNRIRSFFGDNAASQFISGLPGDLGSLSFDAIANGSLDNIPLFDLNGNVLPDLVGNIGSLLSTATNPGSTVFSNPSLFGNLLGTTASNAPAFFGGPGVIGDGLSGLLFNPATGGFEVPLSGSLGSTGANAGGLFGGGPSPFSGLSSFFGGAGPVGLGLLGAGGLIASGLIPGIGGIPKALGGHEQRAVADTGFNFVLGPTGISGNVGGGGINPGQNQFVVSNQANLKPSQTEADVALLRQQAQSINSQLSAAGFPTLDQLAPGTPIASLPIEAQQIIANHFDALTGGALGQALAAQDPNLVNAFRGGLFAPSTLSNTLNIDQAAQARIQERLRRQQAQQTARISGSGADINTTGLLPILSALAGR